MPLLDLEEAQRRLLAMAAPTQGETIAVEAAAGRYLAAPLLAQRTQPSDPLSAMDGWAVRAADMPGPWTIIGESAVSHPFAGDIDAGHAVRISTGAIVPPGADAVLVQEECRRDGDTLHFEGTPPDPLARHIRPRGLDFTEDAVLLDAGARLSPAALALAIGGGHGTVPVRRRPRVTIIDCGDELRAPGEPLGPGDLPASNGPMLAAMCGELPCDVTRRGPIGDEREALITAFGAADDADLVITSGGASVGDHDLIRPTLESIGAELAFWRVAMKPGKPVMVARRERQIVLGLPGNPVSCFVTAFLFALPLIRAMNGCTAPLPTRQVMPIRGSLGPTGKRAEFIRARIRDGAAEPLRLQDSGAIAPLAMADALIIRPAHAKSIQNGAEVSIFRLYG
ncbi:molybdopterin molybdotransferase MoeA [Croceicoccus sp. YJ47]|uniref:molybdopterin molybdotransferase MoeA n=1 Tax=Croceicoccus sp. YJ47 TaxID=2798724 RepID=UPI0019236EA5|nr:molybdopterin molybdotransferase MoeA [Croceicoccus sp. YJ47]QQN73605.1 molybdopterin molybdotransferase MoeA [Croceicoccus sp. YJ47]